MENLQQIVVQITTAPIVRALAQYGIDSIPTEQKEIVYDDLSKNEKQIFDSFIEMIKTK
jgi:2-iminoacetate synthase ThiH